MNRRTLYSLAFIFCCLMGATLWQPVALAQGDATRQYITGTVLGVGGRFGGRTHPFSLIINRYTSPGEVQQLNAALQSGGQDELLNVLGRMNSGRIAIGNNVGVTANAVIATPQGNGETKLMVLYQRNVNFFELRYGTRSEDYRVGYAEIYLRRNGRSEGTLIPAARVRLRDGNTWEVEDFGEFPARLLGLQVHTGRNAVR